MILTDEDILKSIKNGDIEITPFNKSRLGSNSYDVTLSEHLLMYTEEILDAKKDNEYERFTIPDEGHILFPGKLYLGSTNECTRTKMHVPWLDGKSSTGRLGIQIHATAGKGDIGFKGHWTLEIIVTHPVKVYKNMPIGQISFLLPLGNVINSYALKPDSKYHNQDILPKSSQMFKNFTE